MSFKFIIFITAHNPIQRFDCLLETLRGYDELSGTKDVVIHIDYEHREDKEQLLDLICSNVSSLNIEVEVAPSEFEGFSLTWAHKEYFRTAVQSKAYDFYVYTENDMLFGVKHFMYWYSWKDKLRNLNLEPGFCRYESYKEKLVPFDNYRNWSLTEPTRDVWGKRPYQVQTYLTPLSEEIVCFASLGNPYMGMMILDQHMADDYIHSDSFDPFKSFELTKFRCWPIADRSSMGTVFENLRGMQEHRRVVPVIRSANSPLIHPCALIEHRDTKYSQRLENELGSVLDISELFCV
jgi:hypothetical protein